jgi:cytochrome P450
MPMERLAPAEFQVDGHHIPENTIVSIHPHAAHRDPIVYGDDVESFRPERWLEVDAARAKLMERNYLVVRPALPSPPNFGR